jgi:cysteine-rich repeat protein
MPREPASSVFNFTFEANPALALASPAELPLTTSLNFLSLSVGNETWTAGDRVTFASTADACAAGPRVGGEHEVKSGANAIALDPPITAVGTYRPCYQSAQSPGVWESIPAPVITVTACGNGVLEGSETCDDGNAVAGDGCDLQCQAEVAADSGAAFTCTGTAPSTCALCGNRKVEPTETCDDGNTVAGDGCDASCQIEPGFACAGDPLMPSLSLCAAPGNGRVEGAEQCDDGNTVSGDGCSPLGQLEPGGFTCVSPAVTTTTGTGTGAAAAGAIVPARTVCTRCGNLVVELGEQCDDGNTVSGDGCSATCTVEPGFSCGRAVGANSTLCQRCGNGRIEGTESCDDGNIVPGDGCSRLCEIEEGWACAAPGIPCAKFGCGDGIVRCTEACDDGNSGSGDGCSAGCLVEPGYVCSGEPSRCQRCGNGRVEGTEACDDGNGDAGDGCSAECVVEPGFSCGVDASTGSSVCGETASFKLASQMAPLAGPVGGGTRVEFRIAGVASLVGVACRFRFSPTVSTVQPGIDTGTATLLACASPRVPVDAASSSSSSSPTEFSGVGFTTAAVEVILPTTSEVIPAETTHVFTFYAVPLVSAIAPSLLHTSGGTITVYGFGFDGHGDTAAANGTVSPSAGSTDSVKPVVLLRETASGGPGSLLSHLSFSSSPSLSFSLPSPPQRLRSLSRDRPGIEHQHRRIQPRQSTGTLSRVSNTTMRSTTQLVAVLPFFPPGTRYVAVSLNDGADVHGEAPIVFEVCPPGSASPNVQTPCSVCPPGAYQARSGATECERCPIEQFAPLAGSSACTVCPAGTDTRASLAAPDSIGHCKCAPGFFHPQGANGTACLPCKDGGRCDGGAAPPVPRPGYWSLSAFELFMPCDVASACPGLGYGKCAEGYLGIRCGDCQDGFYSLNGRCVSCPANRNERFYIFGAMLVILTALAVILVRGGKRKQLLTTFTLASNFFQVLGIVMSMELNWPARVSSTVALLTMPFNLNADLLATECTVKVGFDGKWAVTLALPVVFALLLGIMYLLGRLRIWMRFRGHRDATIDAHEIELINAATQQRQGSRVPGRKSVRPVVGTHSASGAISPRGGIGVAFNADNTDTPAPVSGGAAMDAARDRVEAATVGPRVKVQRLQHSIVNAFWLLISVMYLVIASSSLRLFDCSQKGEGGISFLDSEPSRQCYDAWWWRRFPPACAAVLVYVVGIPLGALVLVRRARNSLSDDHFVRRYGSIAGKYKSNHPAWEVLVMARKLCVVLSKTMFTSIPLLQALAALTAIVVSLALHIQFHPLVEPRANVLETTLLACSTAVLLAGILLSGSGFDPDGYRHRVVVVAVIAIIAAACAVILYSVVFEIWFSLRRVRRRERADVLDREQLARLFLPERVATVLAWSADARTPRDDVLALEDVMVGFVASTRERGVGDHGIGDHGIGNHGIGNDGKSHTGDGGYGADPEATEEAAEHLLPVLRRMCQAWVGEDRLGEVASFLLLTKPPERRAFAALMTALSAHGRELTGRSKAYQSQGADGPLPASSSSPSLSPSASVPFWSPPAIDRVQRTLADLVVPAIDGSMRGDATPLLQSILTPLAEHRDPDIDAATATALDSALASLRAEVGLASPQQPPAGATTSAGAGASAGTSAGAGTSGGAGAGAGATPGQVGALLLPGGRRGSVWSLFSSASDTASAELSDAGSARLSDADSIELADAESGGLSDTGSDWSD